MGKNYICDHCFSTFNSRTHYYVHNKRKGCTILKKDSKSFKCSSCGNKYANRKLLWEHKQRDHRSNSHLQNDPWSDSHEKRPWEDDKNNIINENLKKVYDIHRSIILKSNETNSHKTENTMKSFYNFPIAGDVDYIEHLKAIFIDQKMTFKVNLSYGVILQHLVTGEYRYFVPHTNSDVFERPQSVSNPSSIDKLSKLLQTFSIDDQVLLQRPNTKWKPVLITNVTYTVYRTSFPLGAEKKNSPRWLRRKRCVITLENGDGNLCAFRCLAYHLCKRKRGIERETKRLFQKWCEHRRISKTEEFKGLLVPDDVPEFESVFNVNVNIFHFDFSKKSASPLYLSKAYCKTYQKRKCTMNLNCYKNHLTYITNISMYTKKYKCRHCDMMFSTLFKLKRHENKPCWKRTIFKYPGGYYSLPKSVFERLQDVEGIDITDDLRCYEWFVMFDLEALLLKVAEHEGGGTIWTRKHHPISVSVCSNVPGYCVPKCFVSGNIEELLKDLVLYLEAISGVAKKLTENKLKKVFLRLEKHIQFWRAMSNGTDCEEETSEVLNQRLSKPNVFRQFSERLQHLMPKDCDADDLPIEYNEWEEIVDEDEIQVDITKSALKMHNSLVKLRSDLTSFCSQIPILGFNSSKYDLNLIKTHLASVLGLNDNSTCFVVKKNNQYLCMATEHFRFLDISHYLPPGTSYSQFLRTFKVSQEKGFFCYEYLDCVEKLKETRLPPISTFWSDLKNRNSLEDEKYEEFAKYRTSSPELSEEIIMEKMSLKRKPKSKEENYNYLKMVWEREKMCTVKDLLIWYNNLDVEPGIEAITKLKKFYWEDMRVDIFKDAISVSGISRILLFRSAKDDGFVFSSIDNVNRDLHECLKANIVGGPSVIFTRYHKAGETYLRRNPEKVCKSCVGYDANALYLNCLSQELPVSYFVRWRPCNQNANLFRKDKSERYTLAFDWLDWVSYKDGLFISHKLNSGSEKCIGPYFVDGFNGDSNTCYEFYGCYFHQCPNDDCSIYKDKKDGNRYVHTIEREVFIKKMGFNIVSMWECTFKEQCKNNKELRDFLNQRDLQFSRKFKGKVKQSDIINAVVDDTLFGMVEVDIHVPSELYEHFAEMSPLFVTSKIPFQEIGEHMKQHAKDSAIHEEDRTLLVGGMKARRLLLATPLLKWYLEQGLKLTRVHQAIEFGKARCFKSFTERITEARRIGDIDPDMTIMADVMKLVGNSAYGGLLLQKEKHSNCRYVHGVHTARLNVNKARFISLTVLPSDNYEIISSKYRTTLDLPMQVGFFVLQYAKLRMLEFYYNFLDIYTHRSDFECLQMDTDSLYLAIAGNSIADIIRPERKDDYDHMLKGYCDRIDITADKTKHYFPRTCCTTHWQRDKRTPGLFKLEGEGVQMISLNSKTYVLQLDETDQENIKLSSKGLNKAAVTQAVSSYKRVLDERESRSVVNRGFRARDNTIYSYEQTRWGISYFYCKRVVQSDGVSTRPLEIELVPAKLNE